MTEHSTVTKRKHSRQRERMLQLLRETKIHPTADWLYEKLKPEFPHLSMGTVYRNLHVLADEGLIRRISFGSTFDRFDAAQGQHYHFICERCGAIIDLKLPVDEELNRRVDEATPFTVRRHSIEFYGLCDRCRRELEREAEAGKTERAEP